MRILGMISGTSHDGIDVAICDIDAPTAAGGELVARVEHLDSVPYPEPLRRRLVAALPPAPTSAHELTVLDTLIGQEFARVAQEAIAAKVGFSVYAEVMAPLAACERWLNRTWSAAADGHRPECVHSLQTALVFAREAAALAQQRFTVLQ